MYSAATSGSEACWMRHSRLYIVLGILPGLYLVKHLVCRLTLQAVTNPNHRAHPSAKMPDNGTQTAAIVEEAKTDNFEPQVIPVIFITSILAIVPVPAVLKYTYHDPLAEPMTTIQILVATTALFTAFVTYGSWRNTRAMAECAAWFLAVQTCFLGFVVVAVV